MSLGLIVTKHCRSRRCHQFSLCAIMPSACSSLRDMYCRGSAGGRFIQSVRLDTLCIIKRVYIRKNGFCMRPQRYDYLSRNTIVVDSSSRLRFVR